MGRRSIIPCCSKRLRRLLNTSRAFGSEMPLCAAYSLTRIGNTTGESAFLNLSINHRSTGESLLLLLFALFFVRIAPLDDSGGGGGYGACHRKIILTSYSPMVALINIYIALNRLLRILLKFDEFLPE